MASSRLQRRHLGSSQRAHLIVPAAAAVHALSSRPVVCATQPEIVWVSSARTCPAACSRHGTRHGRTLVIQRAGGMDQDPYANLFQSPMFRSSLIVKEFSTMVDDLMSLSRMASKFADFDVVGKRMYLEKMRDASGRYEVFMKRLELSEDPASREFLRTTNAQMLNGGFTLPAMFEGLRGSLVQYEQWVAGEEAAIAAGPAQHQEFLKAFRGIWQQTALGAIDIGDLSNKISPEVLMRAQKDPQFWRCIKEVSDTPSAEVMSKWMEHESLGPLVAELARSMLTQQAKRQAQQ